MPRSPRHLPQGSSFHITLRCNSRQFLIAKGLRRDVLLAVLAKAQAKVPHRLYAVCLMANHLHLLVKPDDARQLPRLMHWIGWTSAMALNRLSGRCGHFWEARYYATAIAPKDHRRVLNTLRYIHANPKAAGVRKGFYDPYSNYGHYARLASDGISEWHPSFLQLAQTMKECSNRYERFCQKYRHTPKEQTSATEAQGCSSDWLRQEDCKDARASVPHQGNSGYQLGLICGSIKSHKSGTR